MTIIQQCLMRAKEVNRGVFYYLIKELYTNNMSRKFSYMLARESNSHSIELMFPEILEIMSIPDRIVFKHKIDMEVIL